MCFKCAVAVVSGDLKAAPELVCPICKQVTPLTGARKAQDRLIAGALKRFRVELCSEPRISDLVSAKICLYNIFNANHFYAAETVRR
jgi:hypothetical protein